MGIPGFEGWAGYLKLKGQRARPWPAPTYLRQSGTEGLNEPLHSFCLVLSIAIESTLYIAVPFVIFVQDNK